MDLNNIIDKYRERQPLASELKKLEVKHYICDDGYTIRYDPKTQVAIYTFPDGGKLDFNVPAIQAEYYVKDGYWNENS